MIKMINQYVFGFMFLTIIFSFVIFARAKVYEDVIYAFVLIYYSGFFYFSDEMLDGWRGVYIWTPLILCLVAILFRFSTKLTSVVMASYIAPVVALIYSAAGSQYAAIDEIFEYSVVGVFGFILPFLYLFFKFRGDIRVQLLRGDFDVSGNESTKGRRLRYGVFAAVIGSLALLYEIITRDLGVFFTVLASFLSIVPLLLWYAIRKQEQFERTNAGVGKKHGESRLE